MEQVQSSGSTTPKASASSRLTAGADLFADFSSINMQGFKTLTEGQKVSFEVTMGNKGKQQASNIQSA